jgi:tetratricopeptide (TPR) repeat protein
MMTFRNRFAAVCSIAAFSVAMVTLPAGAQDQAAAAKIHGTVTNPAGFPLASGEVRLTTDKSTGPNRKFEYTFKLDTSGNYVGADIKPGSYTGVVYQGDKSVDFQPVTIAPGDDKTVDFDMTRKEYMDRLSPEEKKQIEDFKKQAGAANEANKKIANLNALLTKARTDTAAGHYDTAIQAMTEATQTKPDEALLWVALGDAQLGDANAAAKTAPKGDVGVKAKYATAEGSYQKALDLNSKAAKPNIEVAASANDQLGQALAREGKTPEAVAAFNAAAAADPTRAGSYYFNEAATLFNTNAIDEAAAAADKAIAADPNKADAYYIKGQALIQKTTMDPKTKKLVAPPECIAAYQKYLELAPTGPHAEEVKGILEGIGEPIKSSYKAPGKK